MKNNTLFVLSILFTGLNGNFFRLQAEDIKPLEIGSAAPDFSLPGTDGETYTLESFKESKILMIVFTANHCPTAQAYDDRILQLYQEFSPRGVEILLVSSNDPNTLCLEEIGYSELGDSFDEMKIRARDKNFPMPYLFDGDKQEMAKAYGPTWNLSGPLTGNNWLCTLIR
jgi:peroxiredoxin